MPQTIIRSRLLAPSLGALLVASALCGPSANRSAAQGSNPAPAAATNGTPEQFRPGAEPQSNLPTSGTVSTPTSRPERVKPTDSLALPALGKKPTADSSSDSKNENDKRSSGVGSTLLSVFSSLAIVLGLFLLCAWLMRRAAPKGSGRLPSEVVEVLGQAQLAARQNVHLLRLGHKLVLVNVSPAGVETLTEVDDPVEVDRLAGLCQQSAPESSSSIFRNVFQQFSREPATDGFLGDSAESNATLASQDRTQRDMGGRKPNGLKLGGHTTAREDLDV